MLEEGLKLELDFGPGNGLLPVVTQDVKSKVVLMLAYANREALERTITTGYATYWSRSRSEIWVKGATSGDLLAVQEIMVNCEQSSLLYLVRILGKGTCHTKDERGQSRRSCYYRKITPNGLEYIQ